MGSNYEWAAFMLAQASPPFPATASNIDNVARWMAAEEPPTTWYHANDPLNVNDLAEGEVESFPGLNVAGVATAAVIRQVNMAAIAAALTTSAPVETFSAAVVASPWSADHYGGNPSHIAQIPTPPIVDYPGWAGPTVPTPEVLAVTPDFVVRLLYLVCLGRGVDPAGYATQMAYLANGGTPSQLLINLQESPEGQAYLAKLAALQVPVVGWKTRHWTVRIRCAACSRLIRAGALNPTDRGDPPRHALCFSCFNEIMDNPQGFEERHASEG